MKKTENKKTKTEKKKTEKKTTEKRKTVVKKVKEKKVILEAFNLRKSYGSGESEVKALDGVSLKVYDGELLVILGSSGSGKSTLLNMLGGMDSLDSGRISIDGENISDLNDVGLTAYRKDKIGFVFQSFNLIAELTARENVALTADTESDPDIIKKVFRQVGLEHKMENYPSQLSGGEQQRVSIARALAKNPQILLCDEPTGALDYESGKQILIQLEKLCRKEGKTVIFVTHTQEIGKMADRVIRMRNGRIIKEQVNKKICSAEKIEW